MSNVKKLNLKLFQPNPEIIFFKPSKKPKLLNKSIKIRKKTNITKIKIMSITKKIKKTLFQLLRLMQPSQIH